jgi:DNA primase large subunit
MTIQFGPDDLAKYPFLTETGNFISGQGISISDLTSPDYARAIDRAEDRIMEAFRSGKVSNKSEERSSKNREIEIMSFPVSLLLVKSTKLDHIIERYALAEALRAEGILKQEKDAKMIEDLFKIVLGIQLEHSVDPGLPKFKISLEDYIKRAVHFHKPEWKLVNRLVKDGKVYVNQEDLIRLIREEIHGIIVERLGRVNPPKLPPNLDATVKRLIAAAPPPPRSPYTVINVKPEDYPPCLREMLNLLEKGQNVPHYGRFLIATYLLAAGKSVEDIMAIFAKAPDFKASITKYQVEHLAGLKGGRTRYSVPSCKTLQTHSLCFKDPIKCYEIASPLQYPSRKRPDTAPLGSRKNVQKSSGNKSSRTKQKTTPSEERRGWTKVR